MRKFRLAPLWKGAANTLAKFRNNALPDCNTGARRPDLTVGAFKEIALSNDDMSFNPVKEMYLMLFINYTNLANANVVDITIFERAYIRFIIALLIIWDTCAQNF